MDAFASIALLALLIVSWVALICGVIWGVNNWSRDSGVKAAIIVANLLLVSGAVVATRFITPGVFACLFYRVLFLRIFCLPVLAVSLFCAIRAKHWKDEWDAEPKVVGWGALAAVISIAGCWYLHGTTCKIIVAEYSFEEMNELIETDPASVRYTPLTTAFNQIVGKYQKAEATAAVDLVDLIELNNGPGYRAPLIPNSTLQLLTDKTTGFVTFDDSRMVPDSDRIKEYCQTFTYGEGIDWRDNIKRALYARDVTAFYPDVYWLDLPGKQGIVAVAPQIKFRFRLPFFFKPEWTAVTLAYASGKFEDVSLDRVATDEILKDKFVAPEWLMKKIVRAQQYEQGVLAKIFSGFPRKNILPTLPWYNKRPARMRGADGRWYGVITTQPSGKNKGLAAVYMFDGNTGKRLVKYFHDGPLMLGQLAAADAAKKLSGFVWGNRTGEYVVNESRIFIRKQQISWICSIVEDSNINVAATAIVNARADDVLRLNNRSEFDSWLASQ